MAISKNPSFHRYYDREIAPYWELVTGVTGKPVFKRREAYMGVKRTVEFTFEPHFHPYAGALIKELTQRSVRGLQAADTDYRTPIALTAQVNARRADGTSTTLPAGEQLSLLDGTTIAAGGANRLLTMHKVVDPATGEAVRLAAGAAVTVRSGTLVMRGGDVRVTLTQDAAATLVASGPRPRFFAAGFRDRYAPRDGIVAKPHPVEELDFSIGGAYAAYNWELFFHVPITVAIHLSRNAHYAEAQRWFHFVFDPTDDSEGPTPERFWKVKPFRTTAVHKIEELLLNLSRGGDEKLREETIESIGAWKESPFRPHVVARYRQSAYMFKTVMAYLDNLIAWGDSLFAQDTIESINEATQLYVLAANILGPRPQMVPKKSAIRPQTYASLRGSLDQFGNAIRALETELPFDSAPHPGQAAPGDSLAPIRGLGTLYFCVPRNDRLDRYWDTVADRMFKIHNSLNLQGVFRQLALFDPPIDPALLARAAAAGVDVAGVVAGAVQPLPLVRSQFLLQKAADVCQEVKALGSALLSAIEKEDGEAMALLRAKHERTLLALGETVRYQQWQEAIKAREGVERSLAGAVERYRYYERLLGRAGDEIAIPDLDAIDNDALQKMRFRSNEPEMPLREIEVDIVKVLDALTGGRKISSHEAAELSLLTASRVVQAVAGALEVTGAMASQIPNFGVQVEPFGMGASITFGGANLAQLFSMLAMSGRLTADDLSFLANMSARIGGFARREQEWAFASNNAASEISQTFKQLRAAQIRESIAKRDWENHKQQIKQAEEIERFLAGEKEGKRTTKQFYAYLRRETKALYGNAFRFAFELARKAERAVQHELGDPQLRFLEFQYLAGNEGLLAGEKLHLDLRRMETSYHELNQREYELTRHVSLMQLDPMALLRLRQTGRCSFSIPEALFDLDCAGHYFRRIRNVAVTIPCVTGPYTSVSCTLTMTKSSIRRTPLLRDGGYARDGAEDDRFSDSFGAVQSIVTSSGQSDAGLFDANLRDERYLPFENAGAVSEWELRLPADLRQFDYDTIADVVLHLRYTAREGGELLRTAAVASLKDKIAEAEAVGSARLIAVKHELATEWSKFKNTNAAAGPVPLTLALRPEHYPYWSRQGKTPVLRSMTLLAKTSKDVTITYEFGGAAKSVTLSENLGKLRRGSLAANALPPATEDFRLFADDNSMSDLWVVLTWAPEA